MALGKVPEVQDTKQQFILQLLVKRPICFVEQTIRQIKRHRRDKQFPLFRNVNDPGNFYFRSRRLVAVMYKRTFIDLLRMGWETCSRNLETLDC